MCLLEDLGRFNMDRKGLSKILSRIIGRQIVRLDFARGYFAIIMTIFTALSFSLPLLQSHLNGQFNNKCDPLAHTALYMNFPVVLFYDVVGD